MFGQHLTRTVAQNRYKLQNTLFVGGYDGYPLSVLFSSAPGIVRVVPPERKTDDNLVLFKKKLKTDFNINCFNSVCYKVNYLPADWCNFRVTTDIPSLCKNADAELTI